jgi:hypothetical protein
MVAKGNVKIIVMYILFTSIIMLQGHFLLFFRWCLDFLIGFFLWEVIIFDMCWILLLRSVYKFKKGVGRLCKNKWGIYLSFIFIIQNRRNLGEILWIFGTPISMILYINTKILKYINYKYFLIIPYKVTLLHKIFLSNVKKIRLFSFWEFMGWRLKNKKE